MSAVSQSYPNYLGGLNEQPDELKKPGQLVEALNVIPDPTIGLTRRPGFEQLASLTGAEPDGTWFEIELSNTINDDFIYLGCVNKDGKVNIFNQSGVKQSTLYARDSIVPHQSYQYYNGTLEVRDENGDLTAEHICEDVNDPDVNQSIIDYFQNEPSRPIKYCISKNHAIFTKPTQVPTLGSVAPPTTAEAKKYYSFINLKVIDTANYNYQFLRFYPADDLETYRYIADIDIDEVLGLEDRDYDRDTSLWLQTEGPYRYKLSPNDNNADVKEDAIIEVSFKGQVRSIKSDGGDGYYNKVTYTWDHKLIYAGKGFRTGTIKVDLDDAFNVDSDVFDGKSKAEIKFKITDTSNVTGTRNDPIVIDDLSNTNSADAILKELKAKFDAVGIDKTVIVGSGLYLENNIEFSVSTDEPAVADVMNSQKMPTRNGIPGDKAPIVRVNSPADLPKECLAGFIVQVSNSFDNKNDYYLKYVSESESTSDIGSRDITKADGFWEEVAKPYERYNPNSSTLPHMITIARERDKNAFVFIVSPIQWAPRTAGTSNDNPSMFIDGAPITSMNYYKNRLFLFTKIGTVISSRAGEINNLFINTAISTSTIDPIDLIANSNQRVPINDSIVVNNAMILFGDTEQYSLSTNESILTSETANITKVSNYSCEPLSKPCYVGTNVGFISSGLSRFYEMTNVYDRGPVDINERSQQIQTLFGSRFNIPASSREQSMVVFYKKYMSSQQPDSSPNMMVYRFRQESSQESSQSSWVKWQIEDRLSDPETNKRVAYVALPRNQMLLVAADRNKNCYLWNMDSSSIAGLPASNITRVPVYLDGYYEDSNGEIVGEPFSTVIKFPTIYPRTKESSDVTANLTIHRVKMSTAAVGTYNLTIERKGYDTYNLLVEQTPADEYRSDYPPLYGEKIETVPVYTRNKNLTLTLHTKYNAPLTLQSMTWEGDYNQPYYKRG